MTGQDEDAPGPTWAVVDLAEQAGITLRTFARGHDFVCYTHAHWLDAGSR